MAFTKLKKFLRTEIISNKYIFIQYWTIVHFVFGFLLWCFFNFKPTVAIILIIGFEFIEPSMSGFKKETKLDATWDIIFGILGYYIARFYLPCGGCL